MIGQTISHYKVLEKIGQGGMGEVYLAEDTSLERKVALKFLPVGLQTDPVAHKRFIREAKSAAAIEHPFICNIKEVAQTDDGQDFIVMEYVEGQTLKDRLDQGKIPIKEALQIGSEVAEALEEAHNRGVVHRDLKPSNIMLTPTGHAKVLDFGLAKRITRDKEDLTSVLTREGTTLGTLAYMSPEQLRGSTVDTRADVFSLGVVLYEMLTGVHPFSTGTQAETVNAILSEHPSPVSRYIQGTPDLLQLTLQKMLAKQPGERYQTVHEIRTNLTKVIDAITSPIPLVEPERRRRWLTVVLGVAGVLVFVLSAWLYFRASETQIPPTPLIPVPLTTTPGSESEPTFSPDGTQVAFTWSQEKAGTDIYIQSIGGGNPTPLTRHPLREYSPSWSPDGRQIAFLRLKNEGKSALLLVPPTGGVEIELTEVHAPYWPAEWGRGPHLAWTHDSKRIVVSDKETPADPWSLSAVSVDTSKRTSLTEPPSGWMGDQGPAISHDGRFIVFTRRQHLIIDGDLMMLELSDGQASGKPGVLATVEPGPSSPTWTVNGEGIVFSNGGRLLYVAAKVGSTPELPEFAGIGSHHPTISSQGQLVFAQTESDNNIWEVELDRPGGAVLETKQLVASTRTDWSCEYSSDGSRISFNSGRSGHEEVWVCDRDGSNQYQLTNTGVPHAGGASWSPDGEWIVFDSRPEGHADIFIISRQRTGQRRLTTSEANDAEPTFSRDGAWVYFASERTGEVQVWKVPPGGGEAVQVTKQGGRNAQESVDGKILYYKNDDTLWSMPVAGGEENQLLDLRLALGPLAVTSEGIYFIPAKERGISYYDLTTGTVSVVTLNNRMGTWSVSATRDGLHLLYAQDDYSNTDLMLVENFQ